MSHVLHCQWGLFNSRNVLSFLVILIFRNKISRTVPSQGYSVGEDGSDVFLSHLTAMMCARRIVMVRSHVLAMPGRTHETLVVEF